ncbi:hypothetical protein DPX39_100006000 [Trypanosoma brucei equiperdum]|uniref:Uncharacterized protein n=1 Tax=Trypanosoma brucei equiperdum TaxID=630700 RepID=A0A3L6L4N8_9TRYP|nr:hypothetical protein DPX39_100006000 [Trypanosoma brucei equiperdum]
MVIFQRVEAQALFVSTICAQHFLLIVCLICACFSETSFNHPAEKGGTLPSQSSNISLMCFSISSCLIARTQLSVISIAVTTSILLFETAVTSPEKEIFSFISKVPL